MILSARGWINKNPRIIVSITLASVLMLLVIIGLLIPDKTAVEVREYEKGWFYDLNTDKLFVAKSDLVPPIESPSGPLPNGELAGVKAYVFSYVTEPNESERFIGFLETFQTEAKEQEVVPVKPASGGAEKWGQGKLIRRLSDEQWVPANSEQGKAILNELFSKNENGQTAHYYPP
jgi:hypothetical protein